MAQVEDGWANQKTERLAYKQDELGVKRWSHAKNKKPSAEV